MLKMFVSRSTDQVQTAPPRSPEEAGGVPGIPVLGDPRSNLRKVDRDWVQSGLRLLDDTAERSDPMFDDLLQAISQHATYGPAVQNNLLKLIIDTAEKKKIPFQRMAASRSTGTDTDAFAYSNGGVASSLISLPLRYMHTTVEMVHREDVENVIRLMFETLKVIKDSHDFRYIK